MILFNKKKKPKFIQIVGGNNIITIIPIDKIILVEFDENNKETTFVLDNSMKSIIRSGSVESFKKIKDEATKILMEY